MQKQEFITRWIEIIKKSSAALVYKQECINRLLEAVRRSAPRHTYDLAWARALVETAGEAITPADRDEYEMHLEYTAAKMLRYYWDQTAFFGLIQGANPCRQPDLICRVRQMLDEYYTGRRARDPVRFTEAFRDPVLRKKFEEHVRVATDILKNDVVARFLGNGRLGEEFIKYGPGEERVILPVNTLSAIRENTALISEAIYYRWAQVLEKYNTSPRLNRKVRIIDNTELRDRPLSYYARYLDLENPGHLCFFCGQPVADKDLSIGHVIPWNYLCSDDIWNLVYRHTNCAAAKSELIPSELTIARLERKNKALLTHLADYLETDMVAGTLHDAVNHGLVRRHWLSCKDIL